MQGQNRQCTLAQETEGKSPIAWPLEPSNTSTLLHESQERVREPTENTSEKICLLCSRKTSGAVGAKKENNPTAAPSVLPEGRVWSPHKTCTSKRVRDNRRTCRDPTVHVCCRFADEAQLFPHSWMTCLQIGSLSHWTLHDIVFHGARFGVQRQRCDISGAPPWRTIGEDDSRKHFPNLS